MIKFILLLPMFIIGCCFNGVEYQEENNITSRQFVLDSIVIEVQPFNDLKLNTLELQIIKSRLDKYKICKSENIFLLIKPSIDTNENLWNAEKLVALKTKYRTISDKNICDRNLVLYLAIVPGSYFVPDKESVAGLSFADSFIVYFGKYKTQSPIILHEIGHSIGLVSRKLTPINPKRPNHCNAERCVMFWIANIKGNFDESCQEEIQQLIDKPYHARYDCEH